MGFRGSELVGPLELRIIGEPAVRLASALDADEALE